MNLVPCRGRSQSISLKISFLRTFQDGLIFSIPSRMFLLFKTVRLNGIFSSLFLFRNDIRKIDFFRTRPFSSGDVSSQHNGPLFSLPKLDVSPVLNFKF